MFLRVLPPPQFRAHLTERRANLRLAFATERVPLGRRRARASDALFEFEDARVGGSAPFATKHGDRRDVFDANREGLLGGAAEARLRLVRLAQRDETSVHVAQDVAGGEGYLEWFDDAFEVVERAIGLVEADERGREPMVRGARTHVEGGQGLVVLGPSSLGPLALVGGLGGEVEGRVEGEDALGVAVGAKTGFAHGEVVRLVEDVGVRLGTLVADRVQRGGEAIARLVPIAEVHQTSSRDGVQRHRVRGVRVEAILARRERKVGLALLAKLERAGARRTLPGGGCRGRTKTREETHGDREGGRGRAGRRNAPRPARPRNKRTRRADRTPRR